MVHMDDMRLISTVSPDWLVGESVCREHAYAPEQRAAQLGGRAQIAKYWRGSRCAIAVVGAATA